MTDLAPGGLELGLEVGSRGSPARRRRPPPGVGGGQEFAPGEEQALVQAKFLGDHGGGLAAGKPVPDGLPLEGRVELAPGFHRGCFDDGFHDARSLFLSVRVFDATSERDSLGGRRSQCHFLFSSSFGGSENRRAETLRFDLQILLKFSPSRRNV
jgi:hypothetical protein